PAGCVALQPAGIGRGTQLAVRLLDRSDTAERPVRGDGDLVPSAAQALDNPRFETALDVQRPALDAAWVERRDQVIGVELGRVDRLLEVQSSFEMPEEDVQPPLLLLVAPGGPPGQPGLALAQGEAGSVC